MNNAELIKAIRCNDECNNCAIWKHGECNERKMSLAAADALEAADEKIVELQKQVNEFIKNETRSTVIKVMSRRISELEAQLPKEGEWLRTDAFPHRVYCSCCYKTYVPNENWQIWQDDADNFGLPRNYCPNCGARMKGESNGES